MGYNHVTPEDIFRNEEVRCYIQRGNDCLGAIGYTEHGFAHAKKSSDTAREILAALGYPQRDCELAAIAGYMHDIGNTVNRVDHAPEPVPDELEFEGDAIPQSREMPPFDMD